MTHQVRAHFGTIDTLAADQGTHAGNVDGIRSALRTHAQQALATLDGGMGADEQKACMDQVDRLIDEYLQSTQSMQRTTGNVGEAFQAGGRRAAGILGSGAG